MPRRAKPEDAKKGTAIRIDEAMRKEVDAIAQELGISRGAVIRLLVKRGLQAGGKVA